MKTDVRLVIVTWLDSRQAAGDWCWLNEAVPQSPVHCASVGWLIQDDEHVKVLCQSMGDIESDGGDIQAAGVKTIPTCCVLKINELAEASASILQEAAE